MHLPGMQMRLCQGGSRRSALPTARKAAHVVGKSRRLALQIVAFRDSSAARVQGVSYYNLLQLSPQQSPQAESVMAAFESLVVAPTQAAYSADTLFSRAVLLKSAAECLANEDLRRSYDHKLSTGLTEFKVPQSDIPGALVLLQETGESDVAIQLADMWLKSNLGKGADVPDVVTCLALALCDRAGAALAAQDSSTSTPPGGSVAGSGTASRPLVCACADLERALGLCEEHDVAHALQDHINEALEGYSHLYAVELLALPLGPAHTQRRARGMTLLRAVLKRELPTDAQERKAHANKMEDMVRRARGVLTAAEQVSLHGDMTRCAALHGRPMAGVAYDTALAYIAEGFAQGWPHYIHCADQLLAEAERAMLNTSADGDAAAAATPQQSPVSLERSCCALLLGRTAAALTGLGLAPGSAHAPDPEIQAFVKENSTSRDDLFPGLVALTKSWLAEAVLGGFREWSEALGRVTAAVQSLTSWFDNPMTAVYCKVYSAVRVGPLLTLIHVLCNLPALLRALLPSSVPANPAASTSTSPTPSTTTTLANSSSSSRNAAPSAATASTLASRLGMSQVQTGLTQAGNGEEVDGVDDGRAGSAGRDGSADVPEHPLMAIGELVGQADTLTVDQLVSRLPRGLLPMKRSVNSVMAVAPSEEASSQRMLRQQLDQMEKAMWDAPSGGKAGGHGGSGAGGPLAALLPRLLGMAAVAAAVLAVSGASDQAGRVPMVAPAVAQQVHQMARAARGMGRAGIGATQQRQ